MRIIQQRGGVVAILLAAAAIGIAVGVTSGLAHAGFETSLVLLAAGTMALILAVSLHTVWIDCASGFQLLLERPIRRGDFIAVGAHEGTVERIGLRTCELQSRDGARLIIPNGDLIMRRVRNWGGPTSPWPVAITVGVGYAAELERARDVVVEAAQADPRVLQQPPPSVTFAGFGPNAVDLCLTVRVADRTAAADAKTELAFAVLNALRAAQIEVPRPQTDIRLRDLEPIRQAIALALEERRRAAAAAATEQDP